MKKIALTVMVLSLVVTVVYYTRGIDHPYECPEGKVGPQPAIIIPKDYSAWRSEFGAGLPDPNSPEGIRKTLADAERLPSA